MKDLYDREIMRLRSQLAGALKSGELNGNALIEAALQKHDLQKTIRNAIEMLDRREFKQARDLLIAAVAMEEGRGTY